MKTLTLTACALALSSFVLAQTASTADARSRHAKRGVGGMSMSNATGGRAARTRSRGATGADTVTRNSAAGGNASQPSRAAPNSSAGGGTGNGGL